MCVCACARTPVSVYWWNMNQLIFFIYFFVFKLIIIDIFGWMSADAYADELFVWIELRMVDWLPNQVTINVSKWCVIYYFKINSRIQSNSFNFMIFVFLNSISLMWTIWSNDLNKIENGNSRSTIRNVHIRIWFKVSQKSKINVNCKKTAFFHSIRLKKKKRNDIKIAFQNHRQMIWANRTEEYTNTIWTNACVATAAVAAIKLFFSCLFFFFIRSPYNLISLKCYSNHVVSPIKRSKRDSLTFATIFFLQNAHKSTHWLRYLRSLTANGRLFLFRFEEFDYFGSWAQLVPRRRVFLSNSFKKAVNKHHMSASFITCVRRVSRRHASFLQVCLPINLLVSNYWNR